MSLNKTKARMFRPLARRKLVQFKAGRGAPWLALPEELWVMVFGYLKLPDRVRAGRTCQDFFRYASDPSFWKARLEGSRLPGIWEESQLSFQAKVLSLELRVCSVCKVLDTWKPYKALMKGPFLLCFQCLQTEQDYQVLNKTESGKQHCLSESDLCQLPHAKQWDKILYRVKDLQARALHKHGGPKGLERAQQAREKRSRAAKKAVRAKRMKLFNVP